MRRWTKSACLAVAWLALPLMAAAGPLGATQLTQATASTANSSTTTTSSSSSIISPASTTQPAPAPQPAALTAVIQAAAPSAETASRPVTWTVRPGDTLTGIAAALGVKGGWPALYAASRAQVGPDPDAIRPGTVLTVPATSSTARYTAAAGDTLTSIAAALGVKGGWPALYAANRPQVGPDPDLLRPGTVLAAPPTAAVGPGTAPSSTTSPRSPGTPAAPSGSSTAPAGSAPAVGTSPPPAGIGTTPGSSTAPAGHSTPPASTTPGQQPQAGSPSAGIMPGWLKVTLLGAALLTVLAFLAEPGVLLARRRRSAAAGPPRRPATGTETAESVIEKATQIIEASHERLIVTYSVADHTIYLLTPPGEDPRAVLRAARLVVPEPAYQELAGHLGVPPAWPADG